MLITRWTYRHSLWLFLLPYIVGMMLLITVPVLSTAGLAFTRFNAVEPPTWIGVENFRVLFASPVVRQSFAASFFFVATAVPLRLFGALGLALLLNRSGFLFRWTRTAVYLPTIIPPPAYALIGLWLFNPLYGPINLILGSLGLPQPAWFTEGHSARWMMTLLSAFQLGEGFIVLLIALQTIPQALYDEAQIHGANARQQFWYITGPSLRPWLLLLLARDVLLSLQNTFTPSYMMTYGGPYYATTFTPLLIYEIAFDLFDLGLASAVLLVVIGLVALIGINVWYFWREW